jgi:hypothetical protein
MRAEILCQNMKTILTNHMKGIHVNREDKYIEALILQR